MVYGIKDKGFTSIFLKLCNMIQIRKWSWMTKCLSRQFAEFGNKSSFCDIQCLMGMQYIYIGNNTYFDDGLNMTAWDEYEFCEVCDNRLQKQYFSPKIVIGDNCSFGAWNHITAINEILIGDGCLTGKWVTITDNNHGESSFASMSILPSRRKLTSKGSVRIGKNVWVGEKVTILPNVTIGDGAIIAANSVVSKDVPAYSVVAGNPAIIVKNTNKNY